MDFTEYQEKAFSTCTPTCYTDEYLDLGYLSEVGELAGKLAKRVRGDDVSDTDIMYEIGDIAWMIAVKARLHGVKLINNISDTTACGFHDIETLPAIARHAHVFKWRALMNVCKKLGFDFNECLEKNIEKLASRQARGKIQGDGDNR